MNRFRPFLASMLILSAWPLGAWWAYASNLTTINDTGSDDIANNLYVSAPASCTGTAAALGDCSLRGAAAAGAAADNTFFGASNWNEMANNRLGLTAAQVEALSGSNLTASGADWVPIICYGPECGHMLMGDIVLVDTNGDGKKDWSLVDQFSWGLTSYINPAYSDNLVPNTPDGLRVGGVAPAGVTRMAVRQALGSVVYQDASLGSAADAPSTPRCAAIRVDNPACTDGVIDGPAAAATHQADPKVFGRCDPDRFHPATTTDVDILALAGDPVAQMRLANQALDNCLMLIATTPLTSPMPYNISPFDPSLDLATSNTLGGYDLNSRDYWVDQAVVGYLHMTNDPDIQDLYQYMQAAAGFIGNADLLKANYANDWLLKQSDVDPNPAVNMYGASIKDTYNYAFLLAVSSASPQTTCAPGDPLCVGTAGNTNSTLDPLWGGAIKRDANGVALRDGDGNVIYDFSRDLGFNAPNTNIGVGDAAHLRFLYAQSVEGYLFTCLNCDTAELIAAGASHDFQPYLDPPTFQPYHSTWHVVPTVVHAPL